MNSNEYVTRGNSTACVDSTSNYTSGNSESITSTVADPFDVKFEKVAKFVSQPFFKIFLWNGAGIYFLNAYRFNYLPKFYFMRSKTFFEFGVSWVGILIEFMWNKAFERK